jgi:hypothetical protein
MRVSTFLNNNPVKGKAICEALLQAMLNEEINIKSLLDEMPTLKIADKGNCMAAIVKYTALNPFLFPYALTPYLNQYLSNQPPRVQWECAQCIALLTPVYDVEWITHTKALLRNAKQGGTVVRWSAANALVAIYVSNKTKYADLKTEIAQLILLEQKNNIQKIYKQVFK